MQIGIIGAGHIGVGVGKRLAVRGHAILVSFSRSQDGLTQAAAAIGSGTRTGSVAEAAGYGEVIVLATPWTVTLDVLREAGAALAQKIIWDCTNPLRPDMSGLAVGTTISGGEEVAAAVRRARVVKAVPPFAEVLHSPSTAIDGRTPSVFVCGDDAAARALVAGLVTEIGADAVDAGPLMLARYTEPLGMLLVQLAYSKGMGARIGVKLLCDAARTGTQ